MIPSWVLLCQFPQPHTILAENNRLAGGQSERAMMATRGHSARRVAGGKPSKRGKEGPAIITRV